MSITQDDFKKIWASTSSVPEYTFSDSDYQDGWEFVGNLPPTRAMWDTLQRRNDQKMKYLQDKGSMCFDSVADMVASNLEAGQTALTKGYYSVNDGGSALYTIRAKVPGDVDDGGSIIFLDNGNVAELIVNGEVNVKQFGAYGDNTHDDTTAIQNAVDYLTEGTGGKLIVTQGLYKTTATINIGLPIVSEYSFMTGRTSSITNIGSHIIAANKTANQSKSHICLDFAPSAMLVASWTPNDVEPVIAYNIMHGTKTGAGSFNSPQIVSEVMIVNGQYDLDAVSVPQTNNLIGIFVCDGCQLLDHPFISGIENGIVALSAYWTQIIDVYVWKSNICVNIVEGNAINVKCLTMWYSNVGLMFDGDAATLNGIHTEQVKQDIIIYKAGTSVIGPGYLEDVESEDGTGYYAVTLGETENAQDLNHVRFVGIRVGAMRPNKKAYRIWGCRYVSFEVCRAISKQVDYDTYSRGILNQCDFTTDRPAKFQVFSGGTVYSTNIAPGTSYTMQGPWTFALNGIDVGEIPAGDSRSYDYTLPNALQNYSTATAHFSYTSGGDNRILVNTRVLFGTPKKIRIIFVNPTASAITPGNCNASLTVFASL